MEAKGGGEGGGHPGRMRAVSSRCLDLPSLRNCVAVTDLGLG